MWPAVGVGPAGGPGQDGPGALGPLQVAAGGRRRRQPRRAGPAEGGVRRGLHGAGGRGRDRERGRDRRLAAARPQARLVRPVRVAAAAAGAELRRDGWQ